MTSSSSKIGVYVDGSNISMNGGYGMRYDVLREFAARDEAEIVRLNAYLSFDPRRSEEDEVYRRGQENFHASLRDMGYKVIQKDMKWYSDDMGKAYGKANVDLEMAVELLLQSQNLDRVLLATGDGDFVQVVRALQNKGCRVEVVAFRNVSRDLKQEADMYFSGYLIPNLLPIQGPRDQPPWADLGSRVRGVCYSHHNEKGFGFLRFLREISPGLWITDTRHPDSPYVSAFFHDSLLPDDVSSAMLPSRNIIFEFELKESPEGNGNNFQATDIKVVDMQR